MIYFNYSKNIKFINKVIEFFFTFYSKKNDKKISFFFFLSEFMVLKILFEYFDKFLIKWKTFILIFLKVLLFNLIPHNIFSSSITNRAYVIDREYISKI